jgi:hypothetical protein
VALACTRAAPVAELGLAWAQKKPVRGEPDLVTVLRLGRAGAPRVREAAIAWMVELVERFQPREAVRPAHLVELLDAPHADVRAAALALLDKDERFSGATELWAALAESPHDDARTHLVAHLERRLGDLEPGAVRHVWASALLAVHRGSRQKPRVAAQLAARIVARPEEADGLLPLLGLLLRSVRANERRTALGALARAAFVKPVLREVIEARLPELVLFVDEPDVVASAAGGRASR